MRSATCVAAIASALALATPAAATWSIVAVDPATREVGIAGASCFPGSVVIAGVVPGRGAVAAQGLTSVAARDRAVALLREGVAPAAIVTTIRATAVDDAWAPMRWLRQYGVASLVGAATATAAYTGPLALPWRGDRPGRGVSVQGNVLRSPAVLDRALAAFTATPERCGLASALLRGLAAGGAEGGDRRCSREQTALSAFLVVARDGDEADAPQLRLVTPDQEPGGANPVELLRELLRTRGAAPDAKECDP